MRVTASPIAASALGRLLLAAPLAAQSAPLDAFRGNVAAIHAHHDMIHCLHFYARQVLGITADDTTFSTSKLFFAYGLGNSLYFPAGAGATTVLLPEKPTAERIFETINRYRPTIFFAVPAVYAAMLQAAEVTPRLELTSVRRAVSAGEALPVPLWERFRKRFGISILDGIGSTEMLHMFISNRPDDVVPGSSGRLQMISPRKSHDPSSGLITHVFLPIQPMPAYCAYTRSCTGPVSTYARASNACGDSARIQSSRRCIRPPMTSW